MGVAHGICRHDCPSHAADHCPRNRRHQYRRSPRRLLLRRNAHQQAARLKKLRADRSQAEVDRRLNALRAGARGKDNLMPFLYDAVKSYATLGEICDALRDVFGTYEEVAIT